MDLSSSRFRLSAWVNYWPAALVGALCALGWMVQRHQRSVARSAALEAVLADFTLSSEDQAAEAFSVGDFRLAAALLAPVAACPTASASTRLLQARTLECLGHYAEAAEAYSRLDTTPATRLVILRGRKFSQRMASERRPLDPRSREQLYRLHEELMQRGDAVTAHWIAHKLLPDTEPMRVSSAVLLRQLDSEVQLQPGTEPGRMDVTLHHLNPRILAVLQDLKIGTLNVSRSGLDAPKILATLDVQALDLSGNGFSDLSGVRPLPLRRLQLSDTRTADLRPLAGMPLRELSLARTMVTSLRPLSMCPLEKLNLASTAVRDLEPLRGLELRELDLSNTRIADLSPLSGMPLERLALNGTSIRDIKPLEGARLKALSLAGTAVKDISVLAQMPLVELDLRGCELLGELEPLARCPHLERVFLPRHLKAPEDRWGLSRLNFIESEQRLAVALK
jgi:hypothetical protein